MADDTCNYKVMYEHSIRYNCRLTDVIQELLPEYLNPDLRLRDGWEMLLRRGITDLRSKAKVAA